VSVPTQNRTEALAGELMSVTAGIRRRVRRRLRQVLPSGRVSGAAGNSQPLTPAQLDLLIVVEAEPGIGVAAAARSLHLAGNSVSALVNALVAADLLRRETDPADRRAARLHLTPVARRRLAHHRETRAAVVGQALERVGPADREAIERALPALRRLLEAL
jgi:DNA-binding MarR family transcriptional regulator